MARAEYSRSYHFIFLIHSIFQKCTLYVRSILEPFQKSSHFNTPVTLTHQFVSCEHVEVTCPIDGFISKRGIEVKECRSGVSK